MADDELSAALAEIREALDSGDDGRWYEAGRRLLAAVDAVLKAHRNADGRCAWCRNPDGQRQKFPCGEYLAITQELTGKDKTDG